MDKKILSVCMFTVMGAVPLVPQAAMLNAGDVLTITPGVADPNGYNGVTSGSYFVLDRDNDNFVLVHTMTALNAGTEGLVIGRPQAPGEIVWATGSTTPDDYYTTLPVSGGMTGGLNFSGWTRRWLGYNSPLGSGAWTPSNCSEAQLDCVGQVFSNGVANFFWSGVYGDPYELFYTARFDDRDPTGVMNVNYMLHLEGVVLAAAVPLPPAMWLFGSGLLGLVGLARKRAVRSVSL